MVRCLMLSGLFVVACNSPEKSSAANTSSSRQHDTAGEGDTGGLTDDGVTWHKDVNPVLDQHCHGCHSQGSISFDLTDPETVALLGEAIVGATQSGLMPPWPPDLECRPLLHERTLSDEEKAILSDWIDRGAPVGDPATAPDPDALDHDFTPPDSDLILTLPEPYTPSGSADDYRCFVVDPELEENALVKGFSVHPDNAAIVHHVLVYTDIEHQAAARDAAEDGPGYTCYGGPGFDETSVIGAWAPGSPGVVLPHDTALSIDAGTPLVVQVHYSPAGDPGGSDQSSVSLDLAEPDESLQPVFFVPFVDGNLNIPPGASNHEEGFRFTMDFGVNIAFFGGGPHMHRLGKSISVKRRKPGDSDFECLMDIPKWDFGYQEIYFLEEPVVLEDGDEVELKCTFNNSETNPYATDEMVNWGDATGDEMCLVYALAALSG